MATLRKWLLAGLLVIVPIALTFWVLEWIIVNLDRTLNILPKSWHPNEWIGFYVPGLGVILAVAVLLVVGAAASNFFGRWLMRRWDSLLNRIPFVRSIYSTVKQVSDTLFSDSGNAFRTAVLVQWPREGVYTIAFVTGAPGGEVADKLQAKLSLGGADPFLSVYVPTTPNPTGGYFVMLPASQCKALDMSVDDALKYIISMGVVMPSGALTVPSASVAPPNPN